MAQYELNIRDYFRIFNRRKIIIFTLFLVVILSTVIYLSYQVPIYEASTTVKFIERKNQTSMMMDWFSASPADEISSQEKIITSYPIMLQVALKLNLITLTSSTQSINNAISSLQEKIKTSRIESTSIIKITVFSESPREAMDIANVVSQAYVENNQQEKSQFARNQRIFIEEQLASLEVKIKEKEEILRQFKESESGVGLAVSIQQKLVELEFQLAANLQRYTEEHPSVVQLKEQIENLKEQLKGFAGADTEYARMERGLLVDHKLFSMFKEKLEEARISEAQKEADVTILDPAVMPPLKTIPYGAGVAIGGIMGLVLGAVFAFLAETLDTSIGTIEDVENVIKLPVLSVIPSIAPLGKRKKGFIKNLWKSMVNPQEAQEEEIYARLIVHHNPKSPISESYRNLRTNLKLGPTNKTILFTSTGPREGKSTVMINLGLTIAQRGEKVIIVSTDLRRPVVAKTFGIKEEPGLHEVLNGSLKLDEVIRNVSDIILGEMSYEEVVKSPSIANIWILPTGKIPPNPAEILSSPRMQEIINELKNRFDYVLFDAPPVLPVTDASILGNKVDSVVLCYEIGRTARTALLRAKNQLESIGSNIIGIVLNHINPQTEEMEQYSYKYGYYYGGEVPEQGKSEKE